MTSNGEDTSSHWFRAEYWQADIASYAPTVEYEAVKQGMGMASLMAMIVSSLSDDPASEKGINNDMNRENSGSALSTICLQHRKQLKHFLSRLARFATPTTVCNREWSTPAWIPRI